MFLLSIKSLFDSHLDFSIIASSDLRKPYEIESPIILFEQTSNGNIALITKRQLYLHKNRINTKQINKETINQKFKSYQSKLLKF